jgi:hypothetical protein
MIAKAAHDLDQLSPHENSCFVLVNPAKISSKKNPAKIIFCSYPTNLIN